MDNPEPYLFAIGAERILIVMFAGLAVYFGYRLFINVPFQNNQKGEIELPGFKAVMSKVGPGVFFAGFGCAVLIASYMHPFEIETPTLKVRGAINEQIIMPDKGKLTQVGLEQSRARTQISVQTLNCLSEHARKSKDILLKDDISLSIRDAKVSLLNEVWDKELWGDFNEFKQWTESGSGKIPEAIKKIYLAKGDC